jgi:hypothetical protein
MRTCVARFGVMVGVVIRFPFVSRGSGSGANPGGTGHRRCCRNTPSVQ